MNTKDINFASEYLFNVEIEKPIIDFKENNLYKYQFALDVLSIGDEAGFAKVTPLSDKKEIIQTLIKYKDTSLLRLNKINNNTYCFSLLKFNKIVEFSEENPLEIIIDNITNSELLKRGKSIDSTTAVKYFKEQLLLDNKYIFMFGSDGEKISILGKDIMVVVEESNQGYMHIVSIFPRRNNRIEEMISLVSGNIDIKDSSQITKKITREFQKKYRELIKDNNGELLRLWDIYNKLDLECECQKARDMGYVEYNGFKIIDDDIVFDCLENVPYEFVDENMSYIAIPIERFDKKDPLNYVIEERGRLNGTVYKDCAYTKKFKLTSPNADMDSIFPQRGFLVPNIFGAKIQSQRREDAKKKIVSGNCSLNGLNVLLQKGESVGLKNKKLTPITEELRKSIFGAKGDFNDNQKKAIDIAINTPDIALIQGPPGTGKTNQVIKAIIERIEKIYNGNARVLLTSTQHAAVNKASRDVAYNGLPANRITSVKTEEAVSPIYNWVDKIIDSCDTWLSKNKKKIKFNNLYKMLSSIDFCTDNELKETIGEMYKEALNFSFSKFYLEQLKDISEKLNTNQAQINQDVDNDFKTLLNLIEKQKTEKQEFLLEGKDLLTKLKRHIRLDCEIENFNIPSYWDSLIRCEDEYENIDKDLNLFKKDLEIIKTTCFKDLSNVVSIDRDKLKKDLRKFTLEEISKNQQETTEEKTYNRIVEFRRELTNLHNIKEIVSSYSKLYAATCQQTGRKDEEQGIYGLADNYQYVIIDEAARSNPLDLLIPMSVGEKIILVGDHKQLPHMVEKEVVEKVAEQQKDEKVKEFLEESLFARLFNIVRAEDERTGETCRTCILNEQYRMHPDIYEVIKTFYKEENLICRTTKEKTSHNLGLYNDKAVVWLDIPKEMGYEGGEISKIRQCEVERIKKELYNILQRNENYKIGIITFYSRQEKIIKQMVNNEFPFVDPGRIMIGTVDAFQGEEFDIVLLSTVRSNNQEDLKKKVGFLNNNNRLCVAMSRAKRLLIVVGDSSTVAVKDEIEPLYNLLLQCKNSDKGYYENGNL